MTSYGLPKSCRLRRPAEYERVYNARCRASDSILLVFAAPNTVGQVRAGMSVSRRHGGAVKRSRLKRLLREAFRQSQHELPQGLDLVLIPRIGAQAGVETYRRSLVELTAKLERHCRRMETRASRQDNNDERDNKT